MGPNPHAFTKRRCAILRAKPLDRWGDLAILTAIRLSALDLGRCVRNPEDENSDEPPHPGRFSLTSLPARRGSNRSQASRGPVHFSAARLRHHNSHLTENSGPVPFASHEKSPRDKRF